MSRAGETRSRAPSAPSLPWGPSSSQRCPAEGDARVFTCSWTGLSVEERTQTSSSFQKKPDLAETQGPPARDAHLPQSGLGSVGLKAREQRVSPRKA